MSRLPIVVNDSKVEVDPGLTVAAALINLEIWHFREAVKGGPRGPICAMGICFECRVTIDGQPHRRACMVACREGMEIRTGE